MSGAKSTVPQKKTGGERYRILSQQHTVSGIYQTLMRKLLIFIFEKQHMSAAYKDFTVQWESRRFCKEHVHSVKNTCKLALSKTGIQNS